MPQTSLATCGFAFALILVSTTDLHADTVPRDRSVTDRQYAELQPLGIRVGAFVLNPEAKLEVQSSDNIFAAESNEESDLISRYGVGGTLESNWNNHALGFNARFDKNDYKDNSTEDNDEYQFGMNGRVDINRLTNVAFDLQRTDETLDRTEAENARSIKPLAVTTSRAKIELNRRFGQIEGRLYGERADLAYSDRVDNPELSNQRDRDLTTLGVRITKVEAPYKNLFLDLRALDTDFSRDPLNQDFDRNSQTQEVAVGSTFSLSGTVFGQARIGYARKDYDDARVDDNVDGIIADARLTWSMTPLTSITGTAARTLEDTTLNGSPGYEGLRFGVAVDHELLRELKLRASVIHREDDYQQLDRNDESLNYEISALYSLNRHAEINLFHRNGNRDTKGVDRGREFDTNQFGIGITLSR